MDSIARQRNTDDEKITDSLIWNFARDNDFHVVTFDEDFVELQNLYGHPPKIIWLRMGNVTTEDIASRLIQLKPALQMFISENESGVMEVN